MLCITDTDSRGKVNRTFSSIFPISTWCCGQVDMLAPSNGSGTQLLETRGLAQKVYSGNCRTGWPLTIQTHAKEPEKQGMTRDTMF